MEYEVTYKESSNEGMTKVSDGYILRTAKVISRRIENLLSLPPGTVLENLEYTDSNSYHLLHLPFEELTNLQLKALINVCVSCDEYTACMFADKAIEKDFESFRYEGGNKGALLMQNILDSLAFKLDVKPSQLNKYVLYNSFVEYTDDVLRISTNRVRDLKDSYIKSWSEKYGVNVVDKLNEYTLLEFEMFDAGLLISQNSASSSDLQNDTLLGTTKVEDLYSLMSENKDIVILGKSNKNGTVVSNYQYLFKDFRRSFLNGFKVSGVSLFPLCCFIINDFALHNQYSSNFYHDAAIGFCILNLSLGHMKTIRQLGHSFKEAKSNMRHETVHQLQTFRDASGVVRLGYIRVTEVES